MPKEVKEAFDNLKDAISNSNLDFLSRVHDFEINVIGTRQISNEQKMTIRFYLKQKIKNNINQYYTRSDTTDRNTATERLLNDYDKLY